jgi:polyisoprenoid-binding protein YceI
VDARGPIPSGRSASGDGSEPPCAWLSRLTPGPIRLSPENTTVAFAVRWLGGLIVRGTFGGVRGVIHVPDDDATAASVSVELASDGIRTGISLRDRHLRGPLFLDASHHPTITFRGGSVMRWPTHLAVPGSLTIRGITRTEELHCTLDEEPGVRRDLVVTLTLSRRSYAVGSPRGLRRLDPLFMVIGDEIRISARVRL